MNVVSYGGGTNSTAMLIGLHERNEPVDLILFADTGGEKPHTYQHVLDVSEWLSHRGMPTIETVSNTSRKTPTLEADCLHYKRLPGIAYGFKSCSVEWKVKPIQARLKGLEHTMLVGIDADEAHRAKNNYGYRYPLLEWDWGREECVEAIKRAGLAQPGKSACFFCPSSKKKEVFELRRMYPALADRAVAMENNAELTGIKGLGRYFAWKDLYAADDAQGKLFPESNTEIDCMCYDGEPA